MPCSVQPLPPVSYTHLIEASRSKWPEAQYIPYFQAHTNTYAPVEVLREKFEPFIGLPGTVGLSIATRADCLPPEVLDYLEAAVSYTHLQKCPS